MSRLIASQAANSSCVRIIRISTGAVESDRLGGALVFYNAGRQSAWTCK
jgi:hypothetical protein